MTNRCALLLLLFNELFLLLTVEALQPPGGVNHRGSNRLFLDTADTAVWEELLPLGIFHGVTTNPTLLERAEQPCTISHLYSLAETALDMKMSCGAPCCREFMCQAWGSTADEMYQIGMELSGIDPERVVIKVPVTVEGTKAAAMLIENGIRVCLTACYNSQQAIVAAGLGAEYLAPYLGRMDDARSNGMAECRRMQAIARGMNSSTRILVASIRNVESMAELMKAEKMDTFTFNPDVARALFLEPLTDQAAEDFEAAAKRGSS